MRVTLHGMNTLNPAVKAEVQQVFSKVLAAIRAQGAPAYEDGSCAYLTSNGRKCAVGVLLPADYPYEKIKNQAWGMLNAHIHEESVPTFPEVHVLRCKVAAFQLDSDEAMLGTALQDAHDRAAFSTYDGPKGFIKNFDANMQRLAEVNGLEFV